MNTIISTSFQYRCASSVVHVGQVQLHSANVSKSISFVLNNKKTYYIPVQQGEDRSKMSSEAFHMSNFSPSVDDRLKLSRVFTFPFEPLLQNVTLKIKPSF